MKKFRTLLTKSIVIALVIFGAISCEDGEDGLQGIQGEEGISGTNGIDGEDGSDGKNSIRMFPNYSVTAPLVRTLSGFGNVEVSSMITSTDIIPATTPISTSIPERENSIFQLPGSADGAGLLQDGDEFIYVVNNEDSYAVSRIRLDANLKPISGDFLLTSAVSDFARQCSGTMWEKEIHGGDRDIFLSASEAFNFDIKGIDPRVVTPTPAADFGLDALGEFSWENAIPLPKNSFPGKTVIVGGDDDSSGSEGQVIMYLSENSDADLTGGKIYVLRTKQISTDVVNNPNTIVDATSNTQYNESNFAFQQEYEVEFVEIVDGKDLSKNEMEDACNDVFATQFMRVEDVDYQKGSDGNGRNVFFAVTGRGPGRTYNEWGTVYKLNLSAENPLEGILTQIISGNTTGINNGDGNLDILQSPDNICVTENFIYVQEDPNSDARNHTAYIYQSDLNGNNIRPAMEFIIDSSLAPSDVEIRDAEYGALIDVSNKVGVPDTFLLALQPHYWFGSEFSQLDGHEITDSDCGPFGGIGFCREDSQASQIVIVRGLPR